MFDIKTKWNNFKMPRSLKEVSEKGNIGWRVINEIIRMLPLLVIIFAAPFIIPIEKMFSGFTNLEAPQFVATVISLSIVCLVIIVFHIARQSLFPYIKLGALVNKASKSPIGAAIVFAAFMLFMMLVIFLSVAKAETYDQKMINRAVPYIPELKQTFVKYWPDAPFKYFEGGKIEQESSWNRFAELHTSREWGVSFSQVTIAYNKDGTVRFNNFEEAKRKYKDLQGWEWRDRFNSKMNFIFIVLEDKTNFMVMMPYFSDNVNRWAGTMVGYNAGKGTVWNRRVLCKLTKGCDYKIWFGGLNTVKTSGESKLLYGRPLGEARDEYPYKIIFKRSPKYKSLFDI